jgi:predicted RNA-binding Zn ribbon-like protein
MATATPSTADSVAPLFIADDVALDFVNTAFGVAPARRECLGNDQDVVDWLRRAGLMEDTHASGRDARSVRPPGKRGVLLHAALELRQTALDLLERRKAGSVGDASALNRVLALSNSHQELVWKRGQPPRIQQHHKLATMEGVLVPVAESIATLLAEGDFDLVRKCESEDCTLWFYDRTKSHHRRWCSMAMCGNRAKVAAFRARQK